MSTNTNGAPAPIRKTTHHAFFQCNANGGRLFAVQAGISLDEALCEASTLLSAAEHTLFDIAMSRNDPDLWACAYLVEFAKAVLDATQQLNDEENHHE